MRYFANRLERIAFLRTIVAGDHGSRGVDMWSNALDVMLRRLVRHGALNVTLPDGKLLTFGDRSGPEISVTIGDDKTLRALILNPELALGEAYTDGRLVIDGDDLRGLLALILSNIDGHQRLWWQRLHMGFRTRARRFLQNNAPLLSRKNVAHHYDLSGEMYDLFLDEDRQYSCAYFQRPGDTLEQAQAQKKKHIARKLLVEPGMRVLDIGCGWGGMALKLARDHGAQVLGITLSEEQLARARQRARDAGLESQVEFRLVDYRALEGQFDRIVSVGMFEHVGLRHFDTYFQSVHDLLTPEGIALIHTIGVSEAPSGTNPWIGKYIFPGGYLPSLSEITASVERQDLWITDVEVLRLHYAKTLRHWSDRFEAHAHRVAQLYDERFVRMWRYYLIASEQTFRHRRQSVFQFQLSRQIDNVPLTRDYIYAPTAQRALQAAE